MGHVRSLDSHPHGEADNGLFMNTYVLLHHSSTPEGVMQCYLLHCYLYSTRFIFHISCWEHKTCGIL